MKKRVSVTALLKQYMMLLVLVVIVLLGYLLTNGVLLKPMNVSNLINQNAYIVILAVGMLICILTGGNIDLAVGSVVALIGACAGTFIITWGWNTYLSVLLCLVIGIGIGIWQGFWIAYRRIPPFIVTLAGMLMFRGLSNIVLDGYTIAPMPEKYLMLFNSYIIDVFHGDGLNITCLLVGILAAAVFIIITFRGRRAKVKKGYAVTPLGSDIMKCAVIGLAIMLLMWRLAQYKGIPNILLWITVIVLIYGYITSKTTVGRHLYAIGGNEKAAQLSGINTNKVYFIAYANMGLLAAVAAMVTIARLSSASPTAGESYEMDAIGSCFIGGASAYGGSGTIPGVIIGATLMGVINLGMSIMGVDANWQKVVKGAVLLAAVIFDVESKKRAK